MPPVRDLDRFGSTTGGPLGVGAGAVAGDDGDAGVRHESCRQGVSAAVGQQVDDPPTLQIAQDGAVAMPLTPSPIVHAQHGDRRAWFRRRERDATASFG